MMSANEYIRVTCPELSHVDSEMKTYRDSLLWRDLSIQGTAWIEGPQGYRTCVSRRFANWFLRRNPEWKETNRAELVL